MTAHQVVGTKTPLAKKQSSLLSCAYSRSRAAVRTMRVSMQMAACSMAVKPTRLRHLKWKNVLQTADEFSSCYPEISTDCPLQGLFTNAQQPFPLFKRPAEILVGSSLIFLVGFRREKEFLMWPSYYPCVLGVQLDIVGYSWIMFRNHVRIVSILDGLEPRHQAAKLPGLQSLRAWSGCTGCIAPRNHQDTLWRYVTISRTCVFELFDTKMIRLNHNKLNACSRLGTRW